MTGSAKPADSLDVLRAAVVAAGRRLAARGLISAGEGNLSVRLGDGSLLVTPTGLRKDELEPEDLVVVPADGSIEPSGAGRRPSSDLAIHRAAMAARPEIGAVVHAHLPASMALTLAGVVPDPTALPETALLLPRLPFVPFDEPGSDALAAAVATALSGGAEPLPGAVLLERHGAVAVGDGAGPEALGQAVDHLELVEVLCRAWRDAVLIAAASDTETARRSAAGPSGGLSFPRRTGGPARGAGSPGRER
ncbi:MAG TPA: class II aldolase/adducin family protein [Candidatus Deferrimicrobiaceae bacterium]|nr:class II aldolase/adducin family protein [Candidatus Deferrimicrobiaceae bacterium]